jgi:hypothetical protein
MKMTSKGRPPQNNRSGISQQLPTNGIFLKFKLKQTETKNSLKWRLPPMESDLKILKVVHFSNHWSNFLQIWNES